MESKMSKEVIIIGGSIAGLMCGIMLKHHGYTVTILEQETATSRQGYDAGIRIGPEVLDFFKKHDRVKREFSIACPSDARRGHGTLVMSSWGLIISILRANFDGRTSKAVPTAPTPLDSDGTASFKNGRRVTDIKEVEGKVQVQYEDAIDQSTETLSADIVIVADGSNSSIRKNILLPDVERRYAGYICWRGTAREEVVAEEWNKQYVEKVTFHWMNRTYALNYTVPTDDGDIYPGKRLHNWLWYSNLAEDTKEMTEIFTDVNGTEHKGTVPRGLVRPEVWEKQKALAVSTLPEGFAAIVQKTASPFATKIYDVASNRAIFFGGKVFMVGDAQVTIRPNVALSSTHAAHDCLRLEEVIEGSLTPRQWERSVLKWDAAQRAYGMTVSSYGLRSKWTQLWNVCRWFLVLFGQKIGVA